MSSAASKSARAHSDDTLTARPIHGAHTFDPESDKHCVWFIMEIDLWVASAWRS